MHGGIFMGNGPGLVTSPAKPKVVEMVDGDRQEAVAPAIASGAPVQGVDPDAARRAVTMPPNETLVPSVLQAKPAYETEAARKAAEFKGLLAAFKRGEKAETEGELRGQVAIVKYVVDHFDSMPPNCATTYTLHRDDVVEFFLQQAVDRGYPKFMAKSYITGKLDKDPKEGTEGLLALLKKGLDD